MQHQTQDKHILIGGSPPFFEAVNDLITYGLFNCHGTVSLVQIAKGEQDMVQASVVGQGNIVGDGERLKNALEAAIFVSLLCCLSRISDAYRHSLSQKLGSPIGLST